MRIAASILGLLLLLSRGTSAEPLVHFGAPSGWRKLGTDPASYDVGTEKGQQHTDAFVKSVAPSPKGYVTLAQAFVAEAFKDKSVRLQANLRSQDLVGWGGLWVRVDDSSGKALFYQRMTGSGVQGTTPWGTYKVDFDVPHQADRIYFGLLLQGTGQAWIDSIGFTVLKTVHQTAYPLPDGVNPSPTNLDFSH